MVSKACFFALCGLTASALSTTTHAAECSHLWNHYLDTTPYSTQVVSGDSNAAYALMAFWGNPDLELVIQGEYPHARFMSIETEKSRAPINVDHIFDYQLAPDAGSVNPFWTGTPIDAANRSFTLLATPDKVDGQPNAILLPGGRLINVLMYRVYRPNAGVVITPADLPKVHARSRSTGEPLPCPSSATRPVRWHFPQAFADAYAKVQEFRFQSPGDVGFLGLNQAAGYVFALSDMTTEQVAIFRFRAPSFVDTTSGRGVFDETSSDVRYWSFCTNNFPNNEGLACIYDAMTTPRTDGYTYIAVGASDLAEAAAERGYGFVPDLRGARQDTMGFVYRNLVPSAAFEPVMTKDEYLPQAKMCDKQAFLDGTCSF